MASCFNRCPLFGGSDTSVKTFSQGQRQNKQSPNSSVLRAVSNTDIDAGKMDKLSNGAAKDEAIAVDAAAQHYERVRGWKQMKLQITNFLASGDSLREYTPSPMK